MKKVIWLAAIMCVAISCKQKETETVETNLPETQVNEEKPVNYKIKSVTRKDFLADYKFGEYTQGEQINKVIRRFDENGLPFEIEIEVMDPSQAKVAGDTLSKSEANVFKYSPKQTGNKIEMYGEDGELAEVLIKKDNTMFGYTIDNADEPFVIRSYDEIGNYKFQVINPGDDYLYVTQHSIIEKDERGFATKSNAMWIQYKKRSDIDYNNIEFSKLEVVERNYQVVEFVFETY